VESDGVEIIPLLIHWPDPTVSRLQCLAITQNMNAESSLAGNQNHSYITHDMLHELGSVLFDGRPEKHTIKNQKFM